ncbi:MAG: response regulator [Deltaproteobacteria bacterium]|uniref:response regulator n=1 Tax=Desulfobacula sp. TaxID=2593537 RepID=UPI0019C0FEDA|nr:response regulator [Candidatus Desulfobacula maris]MBL6993734.1 response regulator [Desulfobacula sp.]
MKSKKLLEGKKILIVDDEPDVLESLIELLSLCKIDTASSFEEGRQMLEHQNYDMAVLDIMGVQGFDLLKVANNQGIPALMLTAHALTEESLKRSIEDGAAYFAPKEKMLDIELFVTDVLEAIEKKKNPWERLLDRLGGFYDKKFQGQNWREQEEQFLKNKINKFI